jgi:cullin 3
MTTTNAMNRGVNKWHLQSFACVKFGPLKKHSPGQDVNPGDSFSSITSSLQVCRRSRLALSYRRWRRVRRGRRRTTSSNWCECLRHLNSELIQILLSFFVLSLACIMRVVKDQKHMECNRLVNEVTWQSAFTLMQLIPRCGSKGWQMYVEALFFMIYVYPT